MNIANYKQRIRCSRCLHFLYLSFGCMRCRWVLYNIQLSLSHFTSYFMLSIAVQNRSRERYLPFTILYYRHLRSGSLFLKWITVPETYQTGAGAEFSFFEFSYVAIPPGFVVSWRLFHSKQHPLPLSLLPI